MPDAGAAEGEAGIMDDLLAGELFVDAELAAWSAAALEAADEEPVKFLCGSWADAVDLHNTRCALAAARGMPYHGTVQELCAPEHHPALGAAATASGRRVRFAENCEDPSLTFADRVRIAGFLALSRGTAGAL